MVGFTRKIFKLTLKSRKLKLANLAMEIFSLKIVFQFFQPSSSEKDSMPINFIAKVFELVIVCILH